MIREWLFRVARSRFAAYFIGNAFAYLTPLMPISKQYEDERVIAFRHPVPFWKIHLLVVPKKRIGSFLDLSLTQKEHQEVAVSIFQAVQTISGQMVLSDYTVLVNGGRYQDVPQLHFHVAAGDTHQRGRERYAPPTSWDNAERQGTAFTYPHPQPVREFHQIICSEEAVSGIGLLGLTAVKNQQHLLDILQLAQKIVLQHQLKAYTLLTNISSSSSDNRLLFHLVSGS
ncbi:MAG: HIT domain-containing protein [Chloroflexi bacterium]|nr:HIT domain-containing protein [Chloroflexota bacterium]